jgi:tRNA threonylcarbamoyladenosine biosynthesis protein TsaB
LWADPKVKILALDTATEACSAALWIDGAILHRGLEVERGHADRILRMIDELLASAGLGLPSLDAIAFGRGPGSFTGVRLAASVTQGLAFGAGLPVIPVSDLQAVAQRVSDQSTATRHILVCNDARMNEVYWACFDRQPDGLTILNGQEHVGKSGDVRLPDSWGEGSVQGAGRGFAAYGELRARFEDRLSAVDDRALPDAREVAILAVPDFLAGRTVQPEDAVPIYLRDDVARPKTK